MHKVSLLSPCVYRDKVYTAIYVRACMKREKSRMGLVTFAILQDIVVSYGTPKCGAAQAHPNEL